MVKEFLAVRGWSWFWDAFFITFYWHVHNRTENVMYVGLWRTSRLRLTAVSPGIEPLLDAKLRSKRLYVECTHSVTILFLWTWESLRICLLHFSVRYCFLDIILEDWCVLLLQCFGTIYEEVCRYSTLVTSAGTETQSYRWRMTRWRGDDCDALDLWTLS